MPIGPWAPTSAATTSTPADDGGESVAIPSDRGITSDDEGAEAGATDDGATGDGVTDGGAADDGATDGRATDGGATDDGVIDDATDGGATDDATDGGVTDDAIDGATDDGATTRVPTGTATAFPTPGLERRVCRVSFGSSRPSSDPPFEVGSAAKTEKLHRGNITTVIAATRARAIVRFGPPPTICFSSEMTDT